MDVIDFFSEESVDLHNTPEQLQRQDRLTELRVIQIDRVAGTGLVYSGSRDSGHSYETSLTKCKCVDFRQRRLPCKHIYRLAAELGVYRSISLKRSTELMADFSKGYADGWAFVVRPCNFPSLDIVYSLIAMRRDGVIVKTTKNGKEVTVKENVLTQGEVYNFSLGQVFYSDPIAYEVQWGDALKVLRCSLQIDDASPSSVDVEVSFGEVPVPPSEKRPPRNGIIRRFFPSYGDVRFSLYRPNEAHDRVEKKRAFTCRQDEFLRLLMTGKFTDKSGDTHIILTK
ncbi:hypothetical protein [Selenomonas dianae]|uniref:SWIM-type domain-containing protein n=1 Tax=Selenomonas dianae TaxID=135079 RepID=A0ABN0SUK0_9FIRM|nr:hypothetical protein [Selenomonas dianae]WLD83133.1 hypothetical protein QU667_03970 [Selenomonas dianae]